MVPCGETVKKAIAKVKTNWVGIVVTLGFVVTVALWDAGWKPHNAFLAGIFFMFTPGMIFVLFRFWERREHLRMTYDNAKLMFRAQRLQKEIDKNTKRK